MTVFPERITLLFERLATSIPGQWEKVILTALLIGWALLASHLWAR